MYQRLGDTGISMYNLFNSISIVLVFLFNALNFQIKKKSLGRISSGVVNYYSKQNKYPNMNIVFAIIESLIIAYFQYYVGGNFNRMFGDLVGTGANYFATLFISPIFVSAISFFIGTDIFKQMDLVTPAYPLALLAVKLACFCHGCCGGVPCEFGLYNHGTKQVEFPTQLLEWAFAAIIFVFLMLYRKKAKEGTLFPIYLILYSATRFFSEFTRSEENVFLGLKTYHILCLVGIAVGVIELFVIKKYKERIRLFSTDYFDAVEDTFNDVTLRMGFKRKDIVHKRKKKPKKRVSVQATEKKNRIAVMKKWIIIWTLGLIGQIGWNVEGAWFNTFIYEKIDKTPSIITPMLIMSALGTTVSIFLFGTLTDRTGKRRNLISSGFVIWGILVACFGLAQYIVKSNLVIAVVYIVIMDVLLSFFASTSTDVGYSTWLTDIMNDSNRGQIGGAIAVQVVLGSLLGNIIGGYLIGSQNNYLRLFIVIGSCLSVFGMISVFLFDKKDDAVPVVRGSYLQQLSEAFTFRNLNKNKELIWIHIAVAVYFIGYNTYVPHLGNVLIQYLGYSATQTGIINALPIIFAMFVTMPVSGMLNKGKFIPVVVISIVTGLAGNLSVFSITPEDVEPSKTFNLRIFVAIFLVGISYITMLQATKTWTKTLYPKEAKGQSEGLWAVAYAFIPMLFGSNIGEWVIKNSGESVLNTATQRYEYIPNGKIFLVGTLISTLSIVPIIITKIILHKKASLEKEGATSELSE